MTYNSTRISEIEQVNVREKWPSESFDFTPWLAENLHLLGNQIGMKLEHVQTEKPVGQRSLDILAKQVDSGAMVAIENQLEWSNNDHLVRLLIYAAGCKAKVVILVAPEFQYEHANTLDWLNQSSKEGVSFYGVKVEVVRKVGKSDLEPRFRKVVYPGGWNQDETAKPDAVEPHILKHQQFFQPLIDELLRRNFADRGVQLWDYASRLFPFRFDKHSGYAVNFHGNSAWVYVHIRTWDSVERNNRIFDEFLDQRDEIERVVGWNLELRWSRQDKQYFSSIGVKRKGTIDDPPEKLAETRAWMFELLPKFKEIFDTRAEEIFSRLSAEGNG